MSEQDDATAAQASLRQAVEQLSGDGTGDDTQAAQEAVQALHEEAGQEWTPEQETQIKAMVGRSASCGISTGRAAADGVGDGRGGRRDAWPT
ncbi:hypothetical protein ACGFYY_40430 [Streptomyces sp. NPDC048331]|uniref:hypothetical protein n=1 Tax=Streptomyces sp. NPDC048331 TaxID=3365534 RepID=UPI003710E077